MKIVTPRVELLAVTPNAEALIYTALRQCYSELYARDIFADNIEHFIKGINVVEKKKLIQRVFESGHTSVSEHVNFTFAIDGVSRAFSHQGVRTRHAVFSQQSQRYVMMKDGISIVWPKTCDDVNNMEAVHIYNNAMRNAEEAYTQLLECGIPAEDARFVLPNATATAYVVTMNCVSLAHTFGLRLCQRCYDEQTEVLTKDGWMLFKDLEGNEEFYSLNLRTENMEYVKAVDHFVYFHNGDMIRAVGQSIDQLVTINHRFVMSNDIDKGSRKFYLKEAYKAQIDKNVFFKKNCNPIKGEKPRCFVIPETYSEGPRTNGEKANFYPARHVDMKTFLQFLGFYLSDGNLSKSEYHRTITLTKGDLETTVKYAEILQRITSNKVSFSKCEEAYKISVHDRNLYDYLIQFGKAHDKHIPNFVWSLDHTLIEYLVEGFIDGDYAKKANQYWTVSKKLADGVQRCLLHIGISGTIGVVKALDDGYSEGVSSSGRKFKIKKRPSDCYTVSFNHSKNEPHIKVRDRNPFKIVQYKGNVYCVELEKNHTLLIRRNGKVSWSGNSQWEYRNVANQMYKICKSIVPVIFDLVGPRCEVLGYCPERDCCGRKITKEELFRRANAYQKNNHHEEDHEFGDE